MIQKAKFLQDNIRKGRETRSYHLHWNGKRYLPAEREIRMVFMKIPVTGRTHMYLHLHWKELKLGSSPAPLNQSGGRFFINSSCSPLSLFLIKLHYYFKILKLCFFNITWHESFSWFCTRLWPHTCKLLLQRKLLNLIVLAQRKTLEGHQGWFTKTKGTFH